MALVTFMTAAHRTGINCVIPFDATSETRNAVITYSRCGDYRTATPQGHTWPIGATLSSAASAADSLETETSVLPWLIGHHAINAHGELLGRLVRGSTIAQLLISRAAS